MNFGSDSVEIIPATRQVKENLFEKELRAEIYNERQNRLRWMSRLGCASPLSTLHIVQYIVF